jgi:hypothetical protein
MSICKPRNKNKNYTDRRVSYIWYIDIRTCENWLFNIINPIYNTIIFYEFYKIVLNREKISLFSANPFCNHTIQKKGLKDWLNKSTLYCFWLFCLYLGEGIKFCICLFFGIQSDWNIEYHNNGRNWTDILY